MIDSKDIELKIIGLAAKLTIMWDGEMIIVDLFDRENESTTGIGLSKKEAKWVRDALTLMIKHKDWEE